LRVAAAAVPAPDPGSAPPADEALPPTPVYRTRLPPAARVDYRLSRGGISGSGVLDWRPEARAYTLRLEGSVPIIGTLLVQTSRGSLDAAGLAPERFTDKRLRRSEQAANFQRNVGKVTFSGAPAEWPVRPGMQDRLSVMLQLSAIANGWGGRVPAEGEHWRIPVVGARGDARVWSLRFEGPQTVETPDGPVQALHFLREPESPYDTRAEFWLDPARSFLPVRARLTDGRGDAFELLRVSQTP
jgi:hypothetical protein